LMTGSKAIKGSITKNIDTIINIVINKYRLIAAFLPNNKHFSINKTYSAQPNRS